MRKLYFYESLAGGLPGLLVKPGRGRKPVFSPRDEETATAEVELLLRQATGRYGIRRSRWRLKDVGRALSRLSGVGDPGIDEVLELLLKSPEGLRSQ